MPSNTRLATIDKDVLQRWNHKVELFVWPGGLAAVAGTAHHGVVGDAC